MKSIRGQLTLLLLVLFGGVLGLAFLIINASLEAILKANLDAHLELEAKALVNAIAVVDGQIQLDQDVDFKIDFEVLDPAGNYVLGNKTVEDALPFRLWQPGLSTLPLYAESTLPSVHRRFLVQAFTPSLEEEEKKGAPAPKPALYRLAVAIPTRETEEIATRFELMLGVIYLGVLGGAALFINALVPHCLSVFSVLSGQIERIDSSQLGTRLSTQVPQEILPFIQKINELFSRLEISFLREKRFSDDVAHELRTPIAELLSLAQVMQHPDSPAESRQAFADVEASAAQMHVLVSALLQLMRNETHQERLQAEAFDLRELVVQSWKAKKSGAEARGLQVSWVGFEVAFPLQTDSGLLGIVLNNLMNNAVDYSPPQGQIVFTLDRDHRTLTLTNPVDNLTDEDLPHLGERFWRKDMARSSSHHFGLGLAMVHAIGQRLQLRINPTLRENTLHYQIEMPCEPGQA